ncbi:MAG: DNA repair protein RecO [Spirochaetota bacterium]|nr:DNA repair protein RecO [Spirochaetota bacterium]
MEIIKSEGIILKKIPVLEADVADIIYTQNHGKRTFIFKGIKKTKRRSQAAIEPGSIVQLVYYYNDQKAMFHVKEFSLLVDTVTIRDNYQAMITLFLLLEVVEKTTGHNDPNITIYRLLKGAIETLHKTTAFTFLALSFIIHYLKLSGIMPDYFHCSVCHKEIIDDLYLTEYQLAAYCNQCAPHNAFIFKATVPLVHEILGKKFIEIETNKYNASDIQKLLFHTLLFIDHYFTIHIKTKELLFNNTKM